MEPWAFYELRARQGAAGVVQYRGHHGASLDNRRSRLMTKLFALLSGRGLRALAVAALTIWLDGCSNGDCGGAAVHGLRIRVVDARTQEPLEQMATVTATEGAYTEVLTIDYSRPNERLYLGASERCCRPVWSVFGPVQSLYRATGGVHRTR